MNLIAEKIFNTRKVIDEDGVEHDYHSSTPLEQCKYLQNIVNEIDAVKCLETGLAFGMSSLFICEAIERKKGKVFYSIDPEQDWWKNIGLKNLDDAGYLSFTKFYRDYSHSVLPRLLRDDVMLDFAYLDSAKVFDILMVDVYYLTRLLRVGGVIVIDDCDYPGVNKLVRYVTKMPHFKIYSLHDTYKCSFTSRTLSYFLNKIPFSNKIFAEKILNTDCRLGVNARCVAFKKISKDERNWDWFSSF